MNFINQEVRRQILIKAIVESDIRPIMAAHRFFVTITEAFSCPFAAVWTMLSREFGWKACRIPWKTSLRISTHCAGDLRMSKRIISVQSTSKIALIKSCRLTS